MATWKNNKGCVRKEQMAANTKHILRFWLKFILFTCEFFIINECGNLEYCIQQNTSYINVFCIFHKMQSRILG